MAVIIILIIVRVVIIIIIVILVILVVVRATVIVVTVSWLQRFGISPQLLGIAMTSGSSEDTYSRWNGNPSADIAKDGHWSSEWDRGWWGGWDPHQGVPRDDGNRRIERTDHGYAEFPAPAAASGAAEHTAPAPQGSATAAASGATEHAASPPH